MPGVADGFSEDYHILRGEPVMKRSALLIIDMQYDFCPGGALAVKDGDAIIPVINRLASLFSPVITTQDWHPRHHISFASCHPGKKQFQTVVFNGKKQTLWPDHCVKGSRGARIHDDLDQKPVNLILRKGTREWLDSYSAFFENDTITSTGLEAYLKALEVTHVYLCGLATDVCVFFSAMDAVRCGFKTHVMSDAIKGVDKPRGAIEKSITQMKRSGVSFKESAEIAVT